MAWYQLSANDKARAMSEGDFVPRPANEGRDRTFDLATLQKAAWPPEQPQLCKMCGRPSALLVGGRHCMTSVHLLCPRCVEASDTRVTRVTSVPDRRGVTETAGTRE